MATGKTHCAHPRHAAQLLQLLWAQAGQDALLQLLLAERISRCSLLPGGCFPLLHHVVLPQLLQKLVLHVLKIIQPMTSLRTLADLERRSTVGTYCVGADDESRHILVHQQSKLNVLVASERESMRHLLDRWQTAQLPSLLWSEGAQQAHGFLALLHGHLLTKRCLSHHHACQHHHTPHATQLRHELSVHVSSCTSSARLTKHCCATRVYGCPDQAIVRVNNKTRTSTVFSLQVLQHALAHL